MELLLRTMLVFLRIAWSNLASAVGAVVSLAPLLGRRRPVGARTAALRTRTARVIPLAERRRVQNR